MTSTSNLTLKHCTTVSLSQAVEAKLNVLQIHRGNAFHNEAVFLTSWATHGVLNLVACNISSLDDISEAGNVRRLRKICHNYDPEALPVSTLYLSDNLIENLHGMLQSQFLHIKNLSLANNFIKNIADVLPLASLPSLANLSLAGNPVSRSAFYRQEVLCICVRTI